MIVHVRRLRHHARRSPRPREGGNRQYWPGQWMPGEDGGSVPVMEHVRLGRSGLQVSRQCLGTMTFGLQCDEETSIAIMDRAAEGGIDFSDPSGAYPLGGDLDPRG